MNGSKLRLATLWYILPNSFLLLCDDFILDKTEYHWKSVKINRISFQTSFSAFSFETFCSTDKLQMLQDIHNDKHLRRAEPTLH